MREEVKCMGEEWNGYQFMGVFLPYNQKHDFSKLTACPNQKLTTIPLHSQCINYLNQLLEELNDWVHKTKWVVESLLVLSLTFGLKLLAQGFE